MKFALGENSLYSLYVLCIRQIFSWMKFKRIIFLNDSTKSHISKNQILFNLSTCLQLHHKSRQIDAVGKFKYLSNLIDSSLSWRLCRSEFSFSEKNYFHSWEVLCSSKGDFSIGFRKIWNVRSKICTSFFPRTRHNQCF